MPSAGFLSQFCVSSGSLSGDSLILLGTQCHHISTTRLVLSVEALKDEGDDNMQKVTIGFSSTFLEKTAVHKKSG